MYFVAGESVPFSALASHVLSNHKRRLLFVAPQEMNTLLRNLSTRGNYSTWRSVPFKARKVFGTYVLGRFIFLSVKFAARIPLRENAVGNTKHPVLLTRKLGLVVN